MPYSSTDLDEQPGVTDHRCPTCDSRHHRDCASDPVAEYNASEEATDIADALEEARKTIDECRDALAKASRALGRVRL